MNGKDLEERQQTLVDRLKAKASTINLNQGTLSELCIILVDTSSSMSESINRGEGRSKIEAVRLAIPNLRAMGVKVMYGLVGFGDTSSIYQHLTFQFGLILSQGEMLSPNGMTNVTAGLREGLQMMSGKFAERKRMILLSDGQANIEVDRIDHQLSLCREGGVIVDTISFGESADKVRLRDIAQKTGGIFSDADSAEELQKVYARLNYTVRYLEHHK
jgi:Mg-chelatase subunit ChlD